MHIPKRNSSWPPLHYRNRERKWNERGFQLVEILVTLGLIAVLTLLATPPLSTWWRGLSVELAAEQLAGALQLARSYAVRHNTRVALRFHRNEKGEVLHTLYRDGDGDGVRRDDIESGVDPVVRASQPVGSFGGVRYGFPPGPAPRDPGGRRLDRLDDPIRFNRSDLASFDPGGTATPGTLYLTDGRFYLFAVRISSRSARVRILRYDPERRRWS